MYYRHFWKIPFNFSFCCVRISANRTGKQILFINQEISLPFVTVGKQSVMVFASYFKLKEAEPIQRPSLNHFPCHFFRFLVLFAACIFGMYVRTICIFLVAVFIFGVPQVPLSELCWATMTNHWSCFFFVPSLENMPAMLYCWKEIARVWAAGAGSHSASETNWNKIKPS